jgi:ABC-2 type transport system permease protein
MRIFLTLLRRELASYFSSLAGYVTIAMVALLLGLSFTMLLEALNEQPADMPITDLFYSTLYFWLILLLAAPLITMRSFALEKSSGTYETLMTTAISDLQVVLAKFTSSMIFYVMMWLPLLGCIFVVRHYSKDTAALDVGPIITTFLGIWLLGCLFISLGCFASSLTRNQLTAAMLSFALGIALFLLSFLSMILPAQPGWQTALLDHISMTQHMQEFVRGVIDTRYVVFYLSLTVLFLFLTCRVVEARRWK